MPPALQAGDIDKAAVPQKSSDGRTPAPCKEVRHLRKGIGELRAEADQEQRKYELETGKMNPAYQPGNNDGRSSYGSPGRSGSRGMGGHGQGR
jgi:hypothetical protein